MTAGMAAVNILSSQFRLAVSNKPKLRWSLHWANISNRFWREPDHSGTGKPLKSACNQLPKSGFDIKDTLDPALFFISSTLGRKRFSRKTKIFRNKRSFFINNQNFLKAILSSQ